MASLTNGGAYRINVANKTVRPNSTKKSEMYTNRQLPVSSERQSLMGKQNSPGKFHLASNKSEARKTIRAKNFGLYYEEFDGHKEIDK